MLMGVIMAYVTPDVWYVAKGTLHEYTVLHECTPGQLVLKAPLRSKLMILLVVVEFIRYRNRLLC